MGVEGDCGGSVGDDVVRWVGSSTGDEAGGGCGMRICMASSYVVQ